MSSLFIPVSLLSVSSLLIALVLHAGGHGDHGQIVGVHDVVDVAG